MGHITTPKFELQFERLDKSAFIMGVNSIKQAKEEIKETFKHDLNFVKELTGTCFLFGNSIAGKNYLNGQNADYYKINSVTLQIEKHNFEIVY